jgi:hypothetical protein
MTNTTQTTPSIPQQSITKQALAEAKRNNALATFVLDSNNSKIGPCEATYASQASCPKMCPHLGDGCYAEEGNVAYTTDRLNAAASCESRKKPATAMDVAKQEAMLIRLHADYMRQTRQSKALRVHVVGDAPTPGTARLIGGAMRHWMKQTGHSAWTYTHGWRKVPVADWQGADVLASCETAKDIKQAKAKGYAAAVVVEAFPRDAEGKPTGKTYVVDGERLLPCPNQTRARQCVECGLCWDTARLKAMQVSIAFEAHGVRSSKVVSKLRVLNA